MARAGRKYRLIIYEYMLNRWWPVTLLVAFFVFLNVGVLWGTEWYFINPENNPLPVLSGSGGTVMLAVGVICLLFSVCFIISEMLFKLILIFLDLFFRSLLCLALFQLCFYYRVCWQLLNFGCYILIR